MKSNQCLTTAVNKNGFYLEDTSSAVGPIFLHMGASPQEIAGGSGAAAHRKYKKLSKAIVDKSKP